MKAEVFSVLSILLLSSAPAFGGHEVATKLVTIETPKSAVSMAFNPEGSQLALEENGLDGTAVYDLKRKQIVHHLPFFALTAAARGEKLVHYSPDGKLLAICGFSKQMPGSFIGIYAANTWEIVHEIVDDSHEGERGCTGISFTPDGRKLVRLAGVVPRKPGNNILVYDTSTWQVIKRFTTQALDSKPSKPERLEDYVVTPDTLLIDPSDPTIVFLDITASGIHAVSPDSRYLALFGTAMGSKEFLNRTVEPVEFNYAMKQSIVIIDIEDHKLAREIRARADSLDWSPEGVRLAVAGGSATDSLSIFDVRSGEKVAAEPVDDGWGLVRYTPDGRYLIASVGKRVKIWDGQHHQLLQTISAYPGNIAVSPDSRYLALSGEKANMLDATPLLSLIAHPNGVPGKTIVYRLK